MLRAGVWLQQNDPYISSRLHFKQVAKGNPFSFLFWGTLVWGPFFFFFFLGPAKLGLLEMQPGGKLRRLSRGLLQPHACAQQIRFQILRRTMVVSWTDECQKPPRCNRIRLGNRERRRTSSALLGGDAEAPPVVAQHGVEVGAHLLHAHTCQAEASFEGARQHILLAGQHALQAPFALAQERLTLVLAGLHEARQCCSRAQLPARPWWPGLLPGQRCDCRRQCAAGWQLRRRMLPCSRPLRVGRQLPCGDVLQTCFLRSPCAKLRKLLRKTLKVCRLPACSGFLGSEEV